MSNGLDISFKIVTCSSSRKISEAKIAEIQKLEYILVRKCGRRRKPTISTKPLLIFELSPTPSRPHTHYTVHVIGKCTYKLSLRCKSIVLERTMGRGACIPCMSSPQMHRVGVGCNVYHKTVFRCDVTLRELV